MNTFNNLLLRTKLAVIFAVILFSAVCFSITSIFIAYRLSQKTDDIYRNNLIPIALLGEVRESIPQSIVLVRDIIIFSGNPSIVEERRAALNAITQHSNFLLTEYEPRISSEAEKRKYEEFKIHLTAFREVRTQILTAALNGNFEEAKVLLLSAQYITSSEKVVQDLHDIDRINREQADEFVAQNHLDAGHARTVILIVSALTVFWIVLSILLLMRSINAPIAELRAKAERIAQGDLEQIIHLSRTDEIGILASSFNSMAASIRIGIEKLQQEKAAIEQKIEEAIRHSESERLALQESAQVLQQGMELFADGDLTVEIAQQRSEVMNQVIISFNRSVREIRGLISQVKDAMETTNLTANQISSAAQQMAVTAQEQAAQTTQISGSVEEMSRSVTESAQSTAKTSALATQSGTQAQNGQTVMQHTIQKIHTITTVVDEAAMVVRRLGDSSVEIGEIIQVIEEIADQTNLLALNAAIEAARAGDQGRGFAVVADEVRKLAERTSQATKQIAGTIRQIQSDTSHAVSGIVNGSSTASAGLQYAEEAGTVFTSIVESVHHVQQLVHDIALVGEQQSTTGEEIAKSIEQVSSSIEETSVTINQVADDAERLRRMMGDVLSLIERFALDDIANQQHSNKKLPNTTNRRDQENNSLTALTKTHR